MANDKDIASYSEAKGATKSKDIFFVILKLLKISISTKILRYFVGFRVNEDNLSPIMNSDAKYSAEEGFDICGHFLIFLSYLLLILGFPFTLCCCIKVVQEYQRAVSSKL